MSLFATSTFTRLILDQAARHGLAAAPLCLRSGIDAARLDDLHYRVEAVRVEALWRECERGGVGRQFGCELSYAIATAGLQGINILLDSATTLGESLSCFIRHLPRVTNSVEAELQLRGGAAILHLHPVQVTPHAFALDSAAISLVRNIARRVGLSPAALFRRLELVDGQYADRLLERHGVASARATHLSLQLPQTALELPLRGSNPFLHQSLQRHWQADSGSSGEADLQLARHWLRANDQPIERIAERLGYRHPNNFIRAFRKQFGITPKQFRLAAGSPSFEETP